MVKANKKAIVKKLSSQFRNYNELNYLCMTLDNDVNLVIKKINQIIKYVFVENNYIYDETSLHVIAMKIKDDNEINKKYNEFLSKRVILPFKKNNNNFSFPLDDDIDKKDLTNLYLPEVHEIEEICRYNREKTNLQEKENRDREAYYKKERVFDEVGLEYTRPELITIKNGFIYAGVQLSGNINKDFNEMYNDDRYSDSSKKDNPKCNDYSTNICQIKKNRDISVRKLGNVHYIKNGRHRILYILENRREQIIPVKITRRVEDKEINIILCNLKKNYNFIVYKNNLLNDEANILLISNNLLYEIKNKNQLIEFYNNIIDKKSNEHFNHISFNIIDNNNRNKIINKYKELIFKAYLSIGEKILTSNFTEVVKYFNGEANSLFYEAYNMIQYEYQGAFVYGYDFKKLYESSTTSLNDNDFVQTFESKSYSK